MNDPLPVTVVVCRRAQAGRGSELVATVLGRAQLLQGLENGPRTSRVFQGVADPDRVLYLAEWPSRETYDHARARGYPASPLPPALTEGAPECRMCTWLLRYEHMGRRRLVGTAAIIVTPTASSARVAAYLCQDLRKALPTIDGLLLRHVYQDLGAPGTYVGLTGWRDETAFDAYMQTMRPQVEARLQALGATITRFRDSTGGHAGEPLGRTAKLGPG
jgi:quinol monooxygenase YgiN